MQQNNPILKIKTGLKEVTLPLQYIFANYPLHIRQLILRMVLDHYLYLLFLKSHNISVVHHLQLLQLQEEIRNIIKIKFINSRAVRPFPSENG